MPIPYPDFESGEYAGAAPKKGAPFIAYPSGHMVAPWQSCQSSARNAVGRILGATGRKAKRSGAPRPGWGALGNKPKASWKSCRNARERMAAAELEYGTSNGLLLTVTLPSISPRAFEALARYSSYAMDRLNRELKRYFADKEFARVAAWEYQERGALHAHIYIAGQNFKRTNVGDFSSRMAYIWHRILASIGEKFDANMFARKDGGTWRLEQLKRITNKKKECVFVNVQKVRKSVVAYLSSYLADSNHEKDSKGKNSLREKFFPIATWFQWNRKATELFDKHIQEIELGDANIDHLPMFRKMLKNAAKRLEKTVNMAKDTKVLSPKNPYNHGMYWLPHDGRKDKANDNFIASMQAKLQPFFKEGLSPYKDDEEDEGKTYCHDSMSGSLDKFTGFYYQAADLIEGQRAKDWAKKMANFSAEMLDFFEKISYSISASERTKSTSKTEQLCLNLSDSIPPP
jgi:hypothetical protein